MVNHYPIIYTWKIKSRIFIFHFLEDSSESEKVFNDLKAEHANHCAGVTAMLTALDQKRAYPGEQATSESLQVSERIYQMAHDLIASIDENQLLIQLATKNDHRPNASTFKK